VKTSSLWDLGRSTVLILTAAAIAGCGDGGAKPVVSKSSAVSARPSKDGPGEAVMAANVFTALVTDDGSKGIRSIDVGDLVTGSLDATDNQLDDGSYYDAWMFTLASPSQVVVEMRSSAVDAFVTLYRGKPRALGESVGYDDDGAGGTDARLVASLEAGTYTIMANSYGGGDTGEYELSLVSVGNVTAPAPGTPAARTLLPGNPVEAGLAAGDPTFDDGTHFQAWRYSGRAGERVTVTMRSTQVDAFLLAYRGPLEAAEWLAEDDDGAGGTDAAVSMVLPTDGTYTFVANTYGAGTTGAYTISLEVSEPRSMEDMFPGGGPSDGRYALLVGIDDYPGTGNDLRGPVEDARIMRQVLVDRFGFDADKVVTLTDSEATRQNIANGIVRHLGQAGPDGVAVFFYSGHGAQMHENIGLTGALDPEPRGDGDEAIYVYGTSRESSVILDEELGYLMETLDADRSLVVVDACYSGEITRAPAGSPQPKSVSTDDPEVASHLRLPTRFIASEVKRLSDLTDLSLGFGDVEAIAQAFASPQRHLMWGASTEDQVSWTSHLGNGASVYTYFLGERLMSAPMGATFAEVQRDVHSDVVGFIEQDGNMTMQNPQLRGSRAEMTLQEFFRQR